MKQIPYGRQYIDQNDIKSVSKVISLVIDAQFFSGSTKRPF